MIQGWHEFRIKKNLISYASAINYTFISKVIHAMKYCLVLLTLICLSCNPEQLLSQSCGTVISQEQEAYVKKFLPQMNAFDGALSRGIRDFPLQVHILRESNGQGGMTLNNLKAAVTTLNSFYINANIRFVVLDDIHYIDDDEFFDFDTGDEEDFCGEHDVPNVINIYFFNSIRTGMHTLCGYAYFPQGKDRVLMTNACAINGSSLPHEFGHYFMLYHTHGKSNTGSTDELVDGSNCNSAGDKVCDTPPDPNLSGKVSEDCIYIGSGSDKNGMNYKPDTYNMMSYAPKVCRQHFTPGQYARINYTALNHRGYLKFPPKRPKKIIPGKEPMAKLSGELILEIEGQKLETKLDENLYKSIDGFYENTNYQLSIINNEPAYVYVIGSNLKKQTDVLFPLEGQSAFLSKQGSRVALPGGDYMYQMDDVKGNDYLCVLYSKKPLDIKNVINQMRFKSGTFMQRLYKTLGDDVVPMNKIKYDEKGELKFSAESKSKTIVPIVVEMKHL